MIPVTTLLAHAALLSRLAAPYPFAVGETLKFEARLGLFPVGTATMSVSRMTRERGTEAFVFAASGQGRPLGLRVGAELTSWVGNRRFASLRFHRRLFQGTSVDESQFQIVPDSSRYRPGRRLARTGPRRRTRSTSWHFSIICGRCR